MLLYLNPQLLSDKGSEKIKLNYSHHLSNIQTCVICVCLILPLKRTKILSQILRNRVMIVKVGR